MLKQSQQCQLAGDSVLYYFAVAKLSVPRTSLLPGLQICTGSQAVVIVSVAVLCSSHVTCMNS